MHFTIALRITCSYVCVQYMYPVGSSKLRALCAQDHSDSYIHDPDPFQSAGQSVWLSPVPVDFYEHSFTQGH